jgi:hypothetical protein
VHFEHLIGLDVLYYFVCYFDHSGTRSGIKVAVVKKGNAFRVESWADVSKIGVYTQILFVLLLLVQDKTERFGFEVNPFEWLYYAFFSGIIFQLVLSYLEIFLL